MAAVDISPKVSQNCIGKRGRKGKKAVMEDESLGLMRRHAAASKNWGILNLWDAARKYCSLCVSRMANHIASLNQIGKEVNTSRGADHDAIKVRGTWDMGPPLFTPSRLKLDRVALSLSLLTRPGPTSNLQLPTSQRPPPNILPPGQSMQSSSSSRPANLHHGLFSTPLQLPLESHVHSAPANRP